MTFIALTIAGSDSGGGAGIQADLKTFQELNVFGTSAITAVTAQNTKGVQGVYPLEPSAVIEQIQSVLDDFSVNAIKTGMLFSKDIIQQVSETIKTTNIPLVVDPVMVAKGGAPLLQEEAIEALIDYLLPQTTVLTPNIPEAELLAKRNIHTLEDMEEVGKTFLDKGVKAVVMKGGHSHNQEFAEDLLLTSTGERLILRSKRIHTKDTHGTGCTFSAAITAELAKGASIIEAVITAKQFIYAAVKEGLGIGEGHGPTNHWAYRWHKDEVKKEVESIERNFV